MKKFSRLFIFTVAVFGLILSGSALAHEFIIKPIQFHITEDHRLPFRIISSHVFMLSEELEPIDKVDVYLINGDTRKAIALKQNDKLLSLDGIAEIKKYGTSLLCGHRKGILWTETKNGWHQSGKKGLKNVISSSKYEKFCKTLIVKGKPDDDFKRVVGHKLEIVPLDDPNKAEINEELRFQVLFNNEPLCTQLYATYDGFSSNSNTYAYATVTDEHGVGKVKILKSGTWMVRVENILDASINEDYDTHILRAIFLFQISD